MPSIQELLTQCRESASRLASLTSKKKNHILLQMAKDLVGSAPLIIEENKKDLTRADEQGISAAMKDRLLINDKSIAEMAQGLKEVARLPDPVGEVVKKWSRPNGLKIFRVRIPLGVVAVIYESRPNVTADAAGLCFKSGNAVVLRGGSEAFHSNQVLVQVLKEVLRKNKLADALITFIPTTDRAALAEMLTYADLIDVAIPRGGDALMKFMGENSKVPVIRHDKGVCNIYVDAGADMGMAVKIIENAKVQRPGVCNAVENVVVHRKAAPRILPLLGQALKAKGVELRGDEVVRKIIPDAVQASEGDWGTEYLDLILSIKVVDDMDQAIDFIRRYGSQHTESIITKSRRNADRFIRELDSSCVMVNASTRFNDGGQLGLGAEIGISTTKLHAFGPMGLTELTTMKFVVYGKGQVRV